MGNGRQQFRFHPGLLGETEPHKPLPLSLLSYSAILIYEENWYGKTEDLAGR
jgi:hypothetical protein